MVYSQRIVFCCLSLALAAIGCATTRQVATRNVQAPVQWGDAVNGLQLGISAQYVIAPPGAPAQPAGQPWAAKVYLRNVGQDPVKVLDLTAAVLGTTPGVQPLVSIETDPQTITRVSLTRPQSPKVITLIPQETIAVSMNLPSPLQESNQPFSLVAQFENVDPVITIAQPADGRPAEIVQDVWTGQVRSGDLPLSQ